MPELAPTLTLRRAEPGMSDFDRAGLSLRVERHLGMAKLRIHGPDADRQFVQATGVPAPRACTQIDQAPLTFAWMGPGEWLVTGSEAAVYAWIEDAASREIDGLLAVDIGHARTSFILTGTDVRDALATHCPLDLWEGCFGIGAAARSPLGETGMFIARLPDAGENPRFRIIVDQTMATYAGCLFALPSSRSGVLS